MLPYILPMIPEHKVYCEPFVGGAAVLFAKKKVKSETINDKLDIVINFYQQLKNNFDELNGLIQATIFSRTLHDKALLIIKNKKMFSEVDLAWAFWMCSNFSYGNKIGGGIKFSNDQSTLPPNTMHDNKKRFTAELVKRIEMLHIENRCALQVINSRDTVKTFHYIDPPYPGADQGHYRGYTWSDFEQLLKVLETAKGKFLLSNYNSPLLDEYIERNGWRKQEFTFRNKGMRKNDREKMEVLVWNYKQPNLNLFGQ